MEKRVSCIVAKEEEGETLERILRGRLGLTRKEISRAKFRAQGILVNGEQKKVIYRVEEGDRVEVLLEEAGAVSAQLLGTAVPLNVLYEDEDLLAVEKPAGLVAHPTGAHYADTLANQAAAYLRKKGEDSVIRMLGRLDKETSGVVLFAKNRAAALRLARQRETGEFTKTYLAVTDGNPLEESGRIDTPIGPDPKRKGKMRTDESGKEARTEYEVLFRDEKRGEALLRVRIFTGRTHQIRVHLSSIGCPLLGDTLYGTGRKSVFERAALHAEKVSLTKPFTGEALTLCAELPEDFKAFLDCAGEAPVLK